MLTVGPSTAHAVQSGEARVEATVMACVLGEAACLKQLERDGATEAREPGKDGEAVQGEGGNPGGEGEASGPQTREDCYREADDCFAAVLAQGPETQPRRTCFSRQAACWRASARSGRISDTVRVACRRVWRECLAADGQIKDTDSSARAPEQGGGGSDPKEGRPNEFEEALIGCRSGLWAVPLCGQMCLRSHCAVSFCSNRVCVDCATLQVKRLRESGEDKGLIRACGPGYEHCVNLCTLPD